MKVGEAFSTYIQKLVQVEDGEREFRERLISQEFETANSLLLCWIATEGSLKSMRDPLPTR